MMDRADLGQQLKELLGRRGPHKIRKTGENPARISVIDVAALLTSKNSNDSAEAIRNICLNHHDVKHRIFDFKFPGRGQKKTPVGDVKGIVASG